MSGALDVEGAAVAERAEQLVQAGRALARFGLVNAFGHVSTRVTDDRFVITPPVPLHRFSADEILTVSFTDSDLPAGVPKEAWIHREIYARRPDVRAICRAQPKAATALASAGVPIRPLHGQGSFLGDQVPVHVDSRLVRDQTSGKALAESLSDSFGLVMRGNGAVTIGNDVGEAVARMWVLEASAEMNATAAASGSPAPLPQDEQEAWRAVAPELLGRIWLYLTEEGNTR